MAITISNVTELQAMETDLAGDYILINDIPASATSEWNSDGSGGYYGFDPIGTDANRFTGTFDGQGYTVSDLYINRPSTDDIGLFGYTDTGAEVRNVGMIDVDVSGYWRVGGLVGVNRSTVSNSYVTGTVSGNERVGGLVGVNRVTVSNSYATGNVSGTDNVGGLVGLNYDGTASNSYATGVVTRTSGTNTNFGGFVGYNYRCIIINSYSTGSVHYAGATNPTDKGFAGNVDTGGDYEMSGNYWNTETSGQSSSFGEGAGEVEGKTTAEMTDYPNYPDAYDTWDFPYPWKATSTNTDQEGNTGYPALTFEDEVYESVRKLSKKSKRWLIWRD